MVEQIPRRHADEDAHLANQLSGYCPRLHFRHPPLYNIDFISEKWRTVNRTRLLGWVNLVCAFVPMPLIIFYAHVQQTSQDYKEMMAAVIAILMSLYHAVRALWGLWKLASFIRWYSVLIQRMWRTGLIDTREKNPR